MAEGAESVLFTQFFQNWQSKDQTVGAGKAYTFNKVAKIDKVFFILFFCYFKALNCSLGFLW